MRQTQTPPMMFPKALRQKNQKSPTHRSQARLLSNLLRFADLGRHNLFILQPKYPGTACTVLIALRIENGN